MDIKYLKMNELIDSGILQEINRQFLHPLGLALDVQEDETGEQRLGGIWDYRDDPEGILFAWVNQEKMETFKRFQNCQLQKRLSTLGFIIQDPTDGPIDEEI